MKASEFLEELQSQIAEHGDKEMAVEVGLFLCDVTEVDLVPEEDRIVIWFKE